MRKHGISVRIHGLGVSNLLCLKRTFIEEFEFIDMSKEKSGKDKSGKTPASKTLKEKRALKAEKRQEKSRASNDL